MAVFRFLKEATHCLAHHAAWRNPLGKTSSFSERCSYVGESEDAWLLTQTLSRLAFRLQDISTLQ